MPGFTYSKRPDKTDIEPPQIIIVQRLHAKRHAVDARLAVSGEPPGLDRCGVRLERYLKIIELEKFARAWPKQLSGGMRRRVAIAAVLANEPDVLLMDEPFVGLDYVRRATLHKVLLDLWEGSGCTVFFITHDVDEALTLADRVLVVVDGRIVHESVVPVPRPRSAQVINSPKVSEIRVRILTEIGSVLGEGA